MTSHIKTWEDFDFLLCINELRQHVACVVLCHAKPSHQIFRYFQFNLSKLLEFQLFHRLLEKLEKFLFSLKYRASKKPIGKLLTESRTLIWLENPKALDYQTQVSLHTTCSFDSCFWVECNSMKNDTSSHKTGLP